MLAVYQRLRAIYAQRYSPESPQVANTISQLAWAHRALGDQVEALAAPRELAAMRANAISADGLSVLHLRLEIGDLLWEQGDHAAAEARLAQLLAANVPVTLLLAQLRRLGLMSAIQGGEAPPQSAPALIALHERLVAWSEQLHGRWQSTRACSPTRVRRPLA